MEENLYRCEDSQTLTHVSVRKVVESPSLEIQLTQTRPWATSTNWTRFKQGTGSNNFRNPFHTKFKEWSSPFRSRCDQVYNSMWQAQEVSNCKSFSPLPNQSSSFTACMLLDVKGEQTNRLFEHLDISSLILLKYFIILASTKKEKIFSTCLFIHYFHSPGSELSHLFERWDPVEWLSTEVLETPEHPHVARCC